MTSGNFGLVFTDSILSDRANRQRRELTGIEELAESIRKIGLINPIVIDRENNLIAGERRLTACRSIGIMQVPVHYIEDLSYHDRRLIELEENVKRIDLSWQDHVRAVDEFHKLKLETEPEWTATATAEELNVSSSQVNKFLTVARNMDNPMVQEADRMSKAFNVSQRAEERKGASAKREIASDLDVVLGLAPAPAPEHGETTPSPLTAEVLNKNFLTWAPEFSGLPFNMIHCDFPYGVGVGDKSGQSAATTTGHYDDTPEIYFKLLNCFVKNQDRFIDPSAHLIFWFSMDFYNETKAILEGAGWQISAFPLIWHKSDNAGIIPDSNRGPRRTYETALFGSRGDRKIVRAVANSFAGPTTREFHTSEKPRGMLTHFFRMLVDENSRVFDPTAGSANAIRVARDMGAEYALGLELLEDFHTGALENLSRGDTVSP